MLCFPSPRKAQLFWQICCICHIKHQIKAEPSSQSAKQTFVISCAGKNLGKGKQHKVQEKDQNISLQSRTSCNKVYKISFFPPWLFLHKLNLFVQRCKADKETRAHTHVYKYTKKTCLKTVWEGVFRTRPTVHSVLAQMHLTSGLGTLNKHKNKSRRCACWAGWQRQRANIGIVFHTLPWLPKQGGYLQKEKERKLGRQWVLGDRLSVCMWRLYWGWRKGEPRESRWKGTFQYCFVLGAWRALSLLHTNEKHISKSPSKVHAVPKHTAMRCGNFTFAQWQAKSRQFIPNTKRCNTHYESTLCVIKNSLVVSCWEPPGLRNNYRKLNPFIQAFGWRTSTPIWYKREKLTDPLLPRYFASLTKRYSQCFGRLP